MKKSVYERLFWIYDPGSMQDGGSEMSVRQSYSLFLELGRSRIEGQREEEVPIDDVVSSAGAEKAAEKTGV